MQRNPGMALNAIPGFSLLLHGEGRGTAMADERKFADAESLRPVVRAALGQGRALLRPERLAGGSKKGAYRLTMGDGGTALAAIRSPSFGKVAFVHAGGRSPGTSCERVMLDRALAQLREIAGRDRRAAGVQGRLEEALYSLPEPIEPRAASALVHGVLGPGRGTSADRGHQPPRARVVPLRGRASPPACPAVPGLTSPQPTKRVGDDHGPASS